MSAWPRNTCAILKQYATTREVRHEALARRAVRAGLSIRFRTATTTGNSLRRDEPAAASARHASRRGRRRGGEFERPYLRLLARRQQRWTGLRQHRLADPGIRPRWRLHPR